MPRHATHREIQVFPNACTIEHPGGPAAVLLLHGWTGYTGRLALLGERLAGAGFSVRLPRLPGHGTNVEDLLSCSWRDWWRKALDEYVDLRERFETVYVAGASMGAALSILLAARFRVPRIALIAPAILVNNPFLAATPVLQYIVPRIPGAWSAQDDPDPDAGPICGEYKTRTYLASLAQLNHLGRLGRRALGAITADTLVIVSRRDEAVPARVAEYIGTRIRSTHSRQLVLERSGHQMVQGVEGETVCDAVVEWFSARR